MGPRGKLENASVIITGAAGGIGRELAVDLAKRKCNITVRLAAARLVLLHFSPFIPCRASCNLRSFQPPPTPPHTRRAATQLVDLNEAGGKETVRREHLPDSLALLCQRSEAAFCFQPPEPACVLPPAQGLAGGTWLTLHRIFTAHHTLFSPCCTGGHGGARRRSSAVLSLRRLKRAAPGGCV